MLDRALITQRHWQLKTTPDGPVWGEISAEYEDLDQEVRACLQTPKKSVPLAPEQGWDMERYRDRNLDGRKLLMVADLREALERDVPRIDVVSLEVDFTFDGVLMRVKWAPKGAVRQQFETEVSHVF